MSTTKFLREVLGIDGAQALEKAVAKAPILEPVLVPRAVVAWLNTAIQIQYEGIIPGIANSYISIKKSQTDTLNGVITVGDSVHAFDGENLLYVAAAVNVALGANYQKLDPMLKGQDISNLGKTIDLLVKAKISAKLLAEESSEESSVEKEEAPGQAAAPRGPEKPLAPIAPVTGLNKPKLAQAANPTLKVTKSEADRECTECGRKQFSNNRLCICFSDLNKNIQCKADKAGNYNLTFKGDVDEDSIAALISVLKG